MISKVELLLQRTLGKQHFAVEQQCLCLLNMDIEHSPQLLAFHYQHNTRLTQK